MRKSPVATPASGWVGFWSVTSQCLVRLRELVMLQRERKGSRLYLRAGGPLEVQRDARMLHARLNHPARRLPGLLWPKQP